ncbi:hypothetical protein ANABIO32_18040 [Rossellomorea marisflavi]|uniref:DUF896 domain-containing protein n=1 Tax=Rossellomorea marisflavi TaxID=189381 RepID=UPI0025C7AA72|nr:DUF896 domain-containing protein [Rossellomorea marisflavi]GLI84105.1 hypothetical protein ANABIO32_18040 [Rossellomorea marisflavi]
MISSLQRINELARKAHEEGLNVQEVEERAALRAEYLQEIRGQVSSTMSSLTIVNEDGEDITPTALVIEKAIQYRNSLPF